jgi:hypothetical protein
VEDDLAAAEGQRERRRLEHVSAHRLGAERRDGRRRRLAARQRPHAPAVGDQPGDQRAPHEAASPRHGDGAAIRALSHRRALASA